MRSEMEQAGGTVGRATADAIVALRGEVEAMEASLGRLQALGLPRQLVHADLHYDNVLCDEASGEVTGLLDFEFCAFDWRAMELAVSLSKYADRPDDALGESRRPLPLSRFPLFLSSALSLRLLTPSDKLVEVFEQFAAGYGAHCRLQAREAEAMPALIALRVLSNVVYFVGRAAAGEDANSGLTSRASNYLARVHWLRDNSAAILDIVNRNVVNQKQKT